MKPEKVYIEYLLMQAQLGDAQAGEQLIGLLQVKLKAFVLKMLGGSAAVDDCVQEALIKVHRKLNQLKAVKAVHTWIYRIAYSTCMDHLRSQKVTEELDEQVADDLTDLEQQLDIRAIMARLPEEQQTIIYLFYYEGFSVAEVADVLAKPAGTVKYQLFAAREQIKNVLQQE